MNKASDKIISLDQGAERIRNGGIVAFATETVYGLGANALNPDAVLKVFEAKQRPSFDPLIVHIADIEDLKKLVKDVPAEARAFAERFWPGPFSMVLPKADCIPDIVTSGLDTVAIRIPSNEIARELIRKAGCPIAAPSANTFGGISPTCAAHVLEQLEERIDGVIDGGDCTVGIESTIVGIRDGAVSILRHGGTSEEEVKEIISDLTTGETARGKALVAPGNTLKHYAPGTPMYLSTNTEIPQHNPAKSARLVFGKDHTSDGYGKVMNLSPNGDLREAALNLYNYMRQLDKFNLECIIADLLPHQGIGVGVNDRMTRASIRD